MKKHFLYIAAAVVLITGCRSHEHAREIAPTSEVKAVAVENNASYVTEVSFKKGSADLTAMAKDKIDEAVSRARRAGTIDDIKVITWADARYPRKDMKALPKAQTSLADKRNRTLNDYLKQQTNASIDTYNMAERPNSLQNLFSTSDARIKRSLEDGGVTSGATDMRYPQNASKSMVMLILKETAPNR